MKRNILLITALLFLAAVYFIFVGYQSRTADDDNQQVQTIIADFSD